MAELKTISVKKPMNLGNTNAEPRFHQKKNRPNFQFQNSNPEYQIYNEEIKIQSLSKIEAQKIKNLGHVYWGIVINYLDFESIFQLASCSHLFYEWIYKDNKHSYLKNKYNGRFLHTYDLQYGELYLYDLYQKKRSKLELEELNYSVQTLQIGNIIMFIHPDFLLGYDISNLSYAFNQIKWTRKLENYTACQAASNLIVISPLFCTLFSPSTSTIKSIAKLSFNYEMMSAVWKNGVVYAFQKTPKRFAESENIQIYYLQQMKTGFAFHWSKYQLNINHLPPSIFSLSSFSISFGKVLVSCKTQEVIHQTFIFDVTDKTIQSNSMGEYNLDVINDFDKKFPIYTDRAIYIMGGMKSGYLHKYSYQSKKWESLILKNWNTSSHGF